MIVSNGERSITRDTNIQDYLLKFGFRRQYCRLNVIYRPLVKSVVTVLYPFRKHIALLPDNNWLNKVQAVLYQEQLRRENNASTI